MNLDLVPTTGVHTAEDGIQGPMAGARVTMLASELRQHGPRRLGELLAGIREWMEEPEYESVEQMQG